MYFDHNGILCIAPIRSPLVSRNCSTMNSHNQEADVNLWRQILAQKCHVPVLTPVELQRSQAGWAIVDHSRLQLTFYQVKNSFKWSQFCINLIASHHFNYFCLKKLNGWYMIVFFRAFAVCTCTWSIEVDEGSDQKIRHLDPPDVCTCAFEEWDYGGHEKCHNLMRWLIFQELGGSFPFLGELIV